MPVKWRYEGNYALLTADTIGTGTAGAPQYPKGVYAYDPATATWSPASPPAGTSPAASSIGISEVSGANDTERLAAAIAAASALYGDRAFVDLEGRSLSITGVTLGNYTKIRNGTLTRASGTAPLLTVPEQGSLQTGRRCIVEDVEIDGLNRTTGTVGLSVLGHSSVILRNVTVINEETGIKVKGGQFCTGYNIKAWNCAVGFYLDTNTGGGGANSWTFYDAQAIGCMVGYLGRNRNPGSLPNHSVILVNPSVLDSHIAAFALFGVDQVTILGSANEATTQAGGGATTWAFDGLTIKAASFYLSDSSADLTNVYIAEAQATACALLDGTSRLALNGISGYGYTTGEMVRASPQSLVVISGRYGCAGSVDGVIRFSGSVESASGMMSVTPRTYPSPIDNAWTGGAAFTNTAGTVASTTGTDPVLGTYRTLTFASSVGSSDTNRALWERTFAANTMIAMTLMSDVDTVLDLRQYPTNAPQGITLRAGRPIRVCWWTTQATTGLRSMVLYPRDSAGATVRIYDSIHMRSDSTDGPHLRSDWSAMVSGGAAV